MRVKLHYRRHHYSYCEKFETLQECAIFVIAQYEWGNIYPISIESGTRNVWEMKNEDSMKRLISMSRKGKKYFKKRLKLEI